MNQISKSNFPCWARSLFNEFVSHQEQLLQNLTLSAKGISLLGNRHIAIEALIKISDMLNQEHEANLEADKEAALKDKQMAEEEVRNGFPLLHEQATVALWSSLEAIIRSFVAGWLENIDGAWKVDSVQKLKIRIGDYESLSSSDRCLWVVDQLDQSVGGPLRNGINRFEALLQIFNLDGPFSEEHQKTIFELSQIRHVIVHRSGKVDRKLIEACPWLGYSKGDRVKISNQMWQKYHLASLQYVIAIIERVRSTLGIEKY